MDQQNRTDTRHTTTPREPVRGIDNAMLLIAGAGLIAFWALIGLMWVEL